MVFLEFYSQEKKSPNSEQPPVGEDKGKIYVITFGTVHRIVFIDVIQKKVETHMKNLQIEIISPDFRT